MDPASGRGGRVIVVGSVNVDLVFGVPRLPRPGETVTGGTFGRHHGGKGANQAVAAARAGGAVHLVGAVGQSDGQDSIDALAAERVDTAAVARLAGVHTGHAAVIVDETGENQIAVAPAANAAVTRDHVFACLGALGVTGQDVIVLSFELPEPPLLAAVSTARAAGATVVVNPAPARACDPEVLRGAVITPNHHELAALVSADRPVRDVAAAAQAVAERTTGPVVATLGAEGALLARGGAVERFPGHRVIARDTTGAGDTLTGVLAAGLADGGDLRTAVRRAVAAAALAVTRVGAREGMPTAGEIDALLAAAGGDARRDA
ncbi:MAG: PfkB family carbohydrate kinase [Micromonosporaceae bacterium]